MSVLRYPVERLENFIRTALTAHDVLEEHARICAARMIEADLHGMRGHGIFRLPPYCRRIREGGYNLRPHIRAERETPVSALVNGDNGLGQVVVTFAAEIAIQKAKENGLAWIGIHHSNHAGAAGVYAAMPLAHDMIGMYMAVANANHMPPWGGTDMLLSTNPIAYAVPAGEEAPFVLDMATTETSYGKVKIYAQEGKPMPEGWMMTKDGKPLTDASRAEEGFLLPIGGHKGYGLNMMIGALAGVLNGAAFGSSVVDFNKDFQTPTNTGQAFFVMRPDIFRNLDDFKGEMDVKLREIKNSTSMEGGGPIRVPGEGLEQRKEEMRQHGVPVAPPLIKRLRELAEQLGLDDKLV